MASVADAALLRPRDRGLNAQSKRDYEEGPSIPLGNLLDMNGASRLLDGRRSVRRGGPVSLPALASTLLTSSRVVSFATADDGYTRTWRPSPSAGGRHPIDLLVDAPEVAGVASGVYWFDAFRWALRPARTLGDSVGELREAVSAAVVTDCAPGATIFLMADFRRTGSRYHHPASLVWRDAGALMATIQLAAIGAGLSSCLAGIGGTVSLPDGTVDVGAVVLGSGA